MKNQRGVVYLETLIGFLPTFVFFLGTLHVADASVANLVMGHAAEAAARAAVVVLPDDGAYYGDEDNHSVHEFRDRRAAEIEHAADIVLSANAHLESAGTNVSLDSASYAPNDSRGERELLTARVTASYRCMLSLLCPGGLRMQAEAQLIYQGARYVYEPATGWLTSAIVRRATGEGRDGRPLRRPDVGDNTAIGDEGSGAPRDRDPSSDGDDPTPPRDQDTDNPPLNESDPIAQNDRGGGRNPPDSDPGDNGSARERGNDPGDNGTARDRGNDPGNNGSARDRGQTGAGDPGNSGSTRDRGQTGNDDPKPNGPNTKPGDSNGDGRKPDRNPNDRGSDPREPVAQGDDGSRTGDRGPTRSDTKPGTDPNRSTGSGKPPADGAEVAQGSKPDQGSASDRSPGAPSDGVSLDKPSLLPPTGTVQPPGGPPVVASNTGPRCSGSTCGIGGSGRGGCFAAGTRVATPTGDRPIEDVAVDDDVYAFDLASQSVVVRRVARAYVRESGSLVDVDVRYALDGKVRRITGTPEHPFYLPAVGDYIALSRLTPGMELRTSDGRSAHVVATRVRSGPFTVFNIEVERAHNYFVASADSGGSGVLVHNRDPNCRNTDDNDDDKGSDPQRDHQEPDDAAQAARDRLAPEWAVDPSTGRFDPSREMDGRTPQEIDDLAHEPPRPGEPHAVERRRRHIAEREAKGQKPLPMREWAESGFRANVNRSVSSLYEGPAVAAVGGRSNNAAIAAGGQNTWTYREWIDPKTGKPIGGVPAPRPAFDENGNPQDPGPAPPGAVLREVTTRPDGVRLNADGGIDIIEHKHMTGNETVYHDDAQLRAQREMAQNNNGVHELVLSSDKGYDEDGNPIVRPSPGAANGTTVKYYDPETGQVTHVWKNGEWVPL